VLHPSCLGLLQRLCLCPRSCNLYGLQRLQCGSAQPYTAPCGRVHGQVLQECGLKGPVDFRRIGADQSEERRGKTLGLRRPETAHHGQERHGKREARRGLCPADSRRDRAQLACAWWPACAQAHPLARRARHAQVGSIEIQVSWTKLTSSPIVVIVKDVSVIACPNTHVQDADEQGKTGLVLTPFTPFLPPSLPPFLPPSLPPARPPALPHFLPPSLPSFLPPSPHPVYAWRTCMHAATSRPASADSVG